MYPSLLKCSKPLLRYKRELVTAAAGLAVMSLSFGAGLGLLLPIFKFLLNEGKTLGELITQATEQTPLDAFGQSVASMVPDDRFYAFMVVMIGILIMTTLGGIGRFVHTYMIIRVTSRVVQYWRTRLYRSMVRMNMATYWQHGMVDGASRIMNDVEYLNAGFQGILVRSTQATLKVVMALTVAFIINWQLTLLALVGGPIIALVVRKFGKSVRKAMTNSLVARSEILERMSESLAELRVIKMSQAEGYESRRFMRSAQSAFREQVRQHRVRAMSSFFVEVLAVMGVIIVAGLSAYHIFRNGTPASEFMMILGALVAAGASFKPITNLHHDLISADASAQRILELRDQIQPDSEHKANELPRLPRHQQSLAFENLVYTYPGAKQPALNGIDLQIGFGEMVAIVGGNGSGKSTLVSVLTRLVKPDSGRVLIDGKDICEQDLRSVRSQMAMVAQKTKLFKGTIADNIAYGRSWARQKDIEEAARLATADLFIKEMPDGYQTPIGEGGEGVSGGQAQRLCIARAVLRKPAVLILDEATSQVDTTSEALIAQAMQHIAEGRTTLVIAHRMSTIVHADRIIVMEHGKIVGQGKHDELMQSCPQYHALATGQLVSDDG